MSQVKRLLDIIQNNIKPKKDEEASSSMRYEDQIGQQDLKELKAEMSKHYRPPWIMTGIAHRRQKMPILKNRQLDNWQIARISLSKRSYAFPKNYHGFKIPSVGHEFSKFDAKDASGHLPYLYEGDLKKIKKIWQKIHKSTFARTNTVKHEYFGFGKIRANNTQIKKNKVSSCSLG